MLNSRQGSGGCFKGPGGGSIVAIMVSPRAVAATPFDFLSALTSRDRNWWRVAIMTGVAPAACFLVTVPIVAILLAWSGDDVFGGGGPRLRQSAIFTIQVAAGLSALAAGVLLSARFVFRRPLRTWITAAPRFRWGLLAWAAGFTCAGVGVLMTVEALTGDRPQLPLLDATQAPGVRLAYIVSVLGALLAAAWAEEVVFRGYLLQQVSAFTHRTWVAIALSSVAFALIHLEFDPAALTARTLAGAAFAWAALRLGGLEFAIGSHLATNLMIALIQAPMLPNDPPFTGGLEDVGLQAVLAGYVVVGVEIAARNHRLIGPAISSPA
jgi:uncharacterized protein